MEFPAVADFACTTALVEAAKSIGATTHVGVTASSDTFYPGQERYDTYSGRVVRRFKGSMEEWQAMGVMNYEMESATLLTMCASQVTRRYGGGRYRQPYPTRDSECGNDETN